MFNNDVHYNSIGDTRMLDNIFANRVLFVCHITSTFYLYLITKNKVFIGELR